MSPDELSEPAPVGRRRFTLIDGMVLVAASAACCSIPRLFEWATSHMAVHEQAITLFAYRVKMIVFGAVIFSATLATLEAVGPRLPGTRRFGRPGGLAMLMVLASWAYSMTQSVIMDTGLDWLTPTDNERFQGDWILRPISEAASHNGLAIVASWTTLLLVGAWKPSEDWLDRSGRVLGGLWLIFGLASGFFFWVWPAS